MRSDRYCLRVLLLWNSKAFTQGRKESYPESRMKRNQEIISLSKYLPCFPQIAPFLPTPGPKFFLEIPSSLLEWGISLRYMNLGNSLKLWVSSVSVIKWGEGNGYPIQYYGLKNSMDRGAWWATVHRVTKSWAQLSDQTELKVYSAHKSSQSIGFSRQEYWSGLPFYSPGDLPNQG